MNPGERANQVHQQYMGQTGQWQVGSTGSGLPASPVPPVAPNALSDRLSQLAAEERARAVSFNLEKWRGEVGLSTNVTIYKLSKVTGEYAAVVNDFVKLAPLDRAIRVWVLSPPDGPRLLVVGEPSFLVQDKVQAFLQSGGSNRKARALRAEAMDRFLEQGKPHLAFRLSVRDSHTASDGAYSDGTQFFIFPTGQVYAHEYHVSDWRLTPPELVERCAQWLHKS